MCRVCVLIASPLFSQQVITQVIKASTQLRLFKPEEVNELLPVVVDRGVVAVGLFLLHCIERFKQNIVEYHQLLPGSFAISRRVGSCRVRGGCCCTPNWRMITLTYNNLSYRLL